MCWLHPMSIPTMCCCAGNPDLADWLRCCCAMFMLDSELLFGSK
jgi:hypothetical protein